ncbi:hypothetical protein CXB51_016958 [Gossypium anomalum]|uniref:Integrase catalytic domain-containing protein n=1 Tax=Gossypium anomalum TaxID=47600 RepID=A0A8J5Z0M8_9ROSI|nr:hypothetical protein CXB51_016958 [Gossypium anomalum]
MVDTENSSKTEISQITQNHSQGIPQGDLNSSLIITNHRLDGKNFLQWSQSVLMALRGRGKIGYINGQIPRPASTDSGYTTWELNNSMVMAWLINSMEGHISRTYLFFKIAKEMWDAIKENYSDLGNASQVFEIKLKLKDIRQGTLEVTQYYNNLKILWQELDMTNRDLEEVRGRILGRTTLPTIGEAFAEVRREEKQRLIMLGDTRELKPLTIAGHRPSENSALISRGPQSQRFKDGIDSGSNRPWCSHCNRVGHTKEKCFKLHGYPGKKQKENKAAMISSTEEDAQDVRLTKTQLEALHKLLGTPTASGSLAIQGTALNTTHEPITTSWILDSGASDHMTGNLSLFHTYLPCHDHSRIRIAGMGTVRLTENFSLDKVLYVPNLSCNLLSISKLTKDEKVLAEFSAFGCVVQEQESGKMIGTAKVDDGLYVWNKKSSQEGMALSTSKEDSIMLWHRRLGHPNFMYLKKLFPLLFLNKKISSLNCEICQLSKHTRVPYPLKPYVQSQLFSLIHSDLWGASRVKNITGARWFITFIDDHTRVCWVYLLKEKSEVSRVFQNFHSMIRTQFNSNIHTLRTDNGREYFNSILSPYLSEQGIIHQSSCPDTPQQNEVSERKNRHLVAVARALMFTMGVPKYLWGKAVLAACYLINQLPSKGEILSEDETLSNLLIIPQDYISPTTTTKPAENPTATVIPVLDPVFPISTVQQQETRVINHTNEEKQPTHSEKQQGKTQGLRVYSRRHQLPETETAVPMPSLPEDCPEGEVSPPSPSIYLPIAVRKGTRSCTQHPISRFVSYGNLSKSYNAFVSNVDSVETPKNIEEALKSTKWRQAVLEEIKALEDNGTWEISKLPSGKKIVGCQWIFTTKFKPDGSIDRHKARLVARGFTQTYGLDYEETFAPVAKLNTIRVLLSIAVNLEWPLIQLDVNNAFLNGELNEVYMDFPPGFEGSKGQVCKLNKSLYGLKQSPRAWFNCFAKAMTNDIILTGDDSIEIERLKEFLSLEFQLKNLGNLRYFLGMEIARSKAGISISQRKYVLDLLSEVGLLGCKPAETLMEPNLKLGTDKDGEEIDRGRYQRILRYLKGTPGKGLRFKKDVNRSIEVYTNADWAGVVNDRRSTSGYCSYVWGNLVPWRSKKQSVVARSSAEAEYRALSHGICEGMWLQRLIGELKLSYTKPITLYCDNQAAVSIAHNPVHHNRTKHVEIDRHFITEKINKGEVCVSYLPTRQQVADVLTKSLSRKMFEEIMGKLGLINIYTPA